MKPTMKSVIDEIRELLALSEEDVLEAVRILGGAGVPIAIQQKLSELGTLSGMNLRFEDLSVRGAEGHSQNSRGHHLKVFIA
ncbi:hypothetical protein [Pyrococcus yayanosii]|uniref:hypothetical protein n=1 Tax=Pyrococcus yayanosii TaxID=1008460 RepID=UPI0013053066|nr:hypothetical protein [Pyrococcus yayanosii]